MWFSAIVNEGQYKFGWIGSVLLMILIVHATNQRLEPWMESLLDFITEHKFWEQNLFHNFFNVTESEQYKSTLMVQVVNPVKTLLFSISVLTIGLPIVREIQTDLRRGLFSEKQQLKRCLLTSVGTFLVLVLLITPVNGITLTGYLQMSIDPYIETDWHSIEHKRFLLPFLAHIFLLHGEFLYFLLHLIAVFAVIFLVHFWFIRNDTQLSFYQFSSLLTSSFIMHQLQVVGNPEVLVFICWLLCITIPLSDLAKLSLLVIALLTHEASIFISPILALFIFKKKKSVIIFLLVCITYLVIWVAGHGFDVKSAVASHNVQEMNTLEWLVQYPERAMVGLLFSYKALWCLILGALISLYKARQFQVALQISLLLSGSLLMTILGVDTARLVGWSFIALLLAVKAIHQTHTSRLFIQTIYGINILIPSVYVGLNSGVVHFPGLYKFYTKYVLSTIHFILYSGSA